MALYKIEAGKDEYRQIMKNIIDHWKKQVPDVCFITLEGNKVYFQQSLLALHSPMLTKIISKMKTTQETPVINVPIHHLILSCLLQLLSDGVTDNNECSQEHVKEAASIIGVNLDNLSVKNVKHDNDGPCLGKRMREKMKKLLLKITDTKKPVDNLVGSEPEEVLLVEDQELETLSELVSTAQDGKDRALNFKRGFKSASFHHKNVGNITKKVSKSNDHIIGNIEKKRLTMNKCEVVIKKEDKVDDTVVKQKLGRSASNLEHKFKVNGQHSTVSKLPRRSDTTQKILINRSNIELCKTGPIRRSIYEMNSKQNRNQDLDHRNKISSSKDSLKSRTLPRGFGQNDRTQKKNTNKIRTNIPSQIKEEKSSNTVKARPKSPPTNDNDIIIEYEEKEESQCPYCYKQFKNLATVCNHMTKQHRNNV